MLDAHEWRDLSKQLILMRQRVLALYAAVPLTEMEIMSLVTRMEMAQIAARQLSMYNGR
jgi:hypothetical protein